LLNYNCSPSIVHHLRTFIDSPSMNRKLYFLIRMFEKKSLKLIYL